MQQRSGLGKLGAGEEGAALARVLCQGPGPRWRVGRREGAGAPRARVPVCSARAVL